MEKCNFSFHYDYLLSKQNLLKYQPFKLSLYRYKKYFENKPIIYILLKGLFGFIFFAIPFGLLILYTENCLISGKSYENFLLFLPIIISCSLLIIFSIFFLVIRIFYSIKFRNFHSWDRFNVGNLIDTLIILIMFLFFLNEFSIMPDNFIGLVNKVYKPLITMLIYTLFRVSLLLIKVR